MFPWPLHGRILLPIGLQIVQHSDVQQTLQIPISETLMRSQTVLIISAYVFWLPGASDRVTTARLGALAGPGIVPFLESCRSRADGASALSPDETETGVTLFFAALLSFLSSTISAKIRQFPPYW